MTQRSRAFLNLDPKACGLSASLSADITLIDRLLGAVLSEQCGTALPQIAQRLYREPADADALQLMQRVPELRDPAFARQLLRAYTILFQLINSAEQKEIVRANREHLARAGDAGRAESIADAVRRLRAAGASAAEMQRLISSLEVCPTLTAHPTEARRRSVLDKLQSLAHALVQISAGVNTPNLDGPLESRTDSERDFARVLTALWQTDEIRATPLTVIDEVANTLYFFEHSLLDVVAWLHRDLRAALREHYPGTSFDLGPLIRYCSWVGGDRDGNPNVTADVTWQALLRQQRLALEHFARRVDALRRELTQSARLVHVSDELARSLADDAGAIALTREQLERYRLEPYALKLVYVRARLQARLDVLDGMKDFRQVSASVAGETGAYDTAEAFVADLHLIAESLRANRGQALADDGALADLLAQATAFGFHLAALDIRQHSEEHGRAIEEMLGAARVGPPDKPYESLEEQAKIAILDRELANPRPLLTHDRAASAHARATLDVFDVIRQAQRRLTPASVTSYVISMTHGVSDMLEVLLLAKEVGLVTWRTEDSAQRLYSSIDVVPLFETIEDLRRCDALMRELLANPTYRLHLESRGMFQEIMLGYSDSSKDGGFFAANWALYDAQSRLARACNEAGVEVRFFHGRGGTVGRGGGRANRAILSQPPGSFSGRIRFTEQGEVISFRYSMPPLGHRHMEQIVSAALLAADPRTGTCAVAPAWRAAMDEMAARSLRVYRELVHEDPQFWDFYTQATPIRYISRLPIASRPASRSRTLAGLDALRAIPWVFAWMQNRYVIPGWYGLGSALKTYAGEDAANAALLSEMYTEWMFFRMVINNAQLELLRAHLPTASWYAQRVKPAELGSRIRARLEQEHALAREWILRITGNDELLAHAPVVRRTVELRNPAVAPLSKVQVALLDLLDDEAPRDSAEEAAWQEAMLLSITGIAAAMQSTG